jgi:hypothetical protein
VAYGPQVNTSAGVLLAGHHGQSKELTEAIMKQIAFATATFALLTAVGLNSASAAERTYPVQAGAVTEGAPCPGYSRSGRPAHYVWKPGYTRKGKWQYHWACEV